MKNKLFNQRGLTLIELLASVVILMLIIGPMLSLTFSLFNYSLEDGERNQSANIGQEVVEEIKLLVRSGQYTYNPSRPEYSDYDIDVEIIDFSENNNLKEINVTVKKINSSFPAVELKTVVRKP
ncbi:MAG: prepilin-type N-terminal cleavage/methylation domain-containing protein [Vulcanibacillus sp.]